MQTTTLISGNGQLYERPIPKIVITTYINDVALENLRNQTCIDFQKGPTGLIEGQPKTWEQFSRIFLVYNWLTKSQNNIDGNIIYLRCDCNTPLDKPLYYMQEGKTFIGVDA